MTVIPLFPTPLYHEKFEHNVDLEYIDNLVYYPYELNDGYTTDNQNILLEEPFKELRDEIEKHLNIFYFDVLRFRQGKLVHSNSWINKHEHGHCGRLHIHANSCYSGVYYLNGTEGGGGLTFHHPDDQSPFGRTLLPEVHDRNMWNSTFYRCPLEAHNLLLFPSHVAHMTEVNQSQENRYSLAFNYFIDGIIGQDTGKLECTVNPNSKLTS